MGNFIETAYAAGGDIPIHLAPDVLGHLFGIPITNTLLTVWLIMVGMILALVLTRKKLKLIPGNFQFIMESLIEWGYDYVKDALGSERYARIFFPIVMTIFIFILAINWIGLLPGDDAIGLYHMTADGKELIGFIHAGNTDLNITLGFTIFAFFTIEIAGVLTIGFLKYAGKFVNFKSPMAFAIGVIEFFSELARLVSFSFRLFGNIFAGKTLLLVAIFFVPFIIPVPLMLFELFVGLIQAFIFAVLTLFFVKLAIEEPH